MSSVRFSVHDVPIEATAGGRELPRAMLAALIMVGLLVVVAARAGWTAHAWVRTVGLALGQGAMLTAALARGLAEWPRYGAILIGLLLVVGTLANVSPWGALAYFAVPVAVIALRWLRPELDVLGVRGPNAWRPVVVGAGVGLLLGGHLLVSANLTLGHRVSLTPISRYLAAIAYDIGVNVPVAECFLRGTLFASIQHRRPVAAAVGLSTAVAVVRYLIDPAFPRSLETVAGAMLYLGALSAVSCGLFRWSASLLPGTVAGVLFFLAYRMVGGW